MNRDVLKKEAIYKAGALARGDGLSVLYSLCENQKTINTRKVLEHVERTHEFMKDCAYMIGKLEKSLGDNIVAAESLENAAKHFEKNGLSSASGDYVIKGMRIRAKCLRVGVDYERDYLSVIDVINSSEAT